MRLKNLLHQIHSHRKIAAVCLLCLCLSFTVVYMTLSYLTSESSLDNAFTVASVQPSVDETFVNKVKENVSIKNDGNIDVYIRARILIYFENAQGEILADKPEKDNDYTMDMGNLSNWLQIGDYYYYSKKVSSGWQTDVLINKCTETENAHPGKTLVVDILAETIQADPETAVEESWTDVDVDTNGQLVQSTSGGVTP